MIAQSNKGYALLIVMMLGIGVGGGWLSIAGSAHAPQSVFASGRDINALTDARQSLLSYAALYPYLYGPGGAGPAHLPCPDTDATGVGNILNSAITGNRLDGPNPPCASLEGSRGRLPRHTVLPGYRYQFHSAPWQMFDYQVAGAVVNNPINRLVNLDTLQDVYDVPVASISLLAFGEQRQIAQTPIMGRALYRATGASVAAWLIQRVTDASAHQCASIADSVGSSSELAPASADLTDSLVSDSDTAVAADADSTDVSATATEPRHCYPETSAANICVDDTFFRHLLDGPVSADGQCLIDALGQHTMEAVPAARHWFFRNRWYESFKVTATEPCRQAAIDEPPCVLTFAPSSAIEQALASTIMELQWRRPS